MRVFLLFSRARSHALTHRDKTKLETPPKKSRPVTGVRAGRAGAALPGWLPLGSHTSNVVSSLQNWTPNFPSYPAGHGAFGAAAFQLVRLFYGVPAGAAGWGPDAVYSGTLVSGEFNGATFNNSGVVRPLVLRGYKDGGLWKAILDNCNSRTFLGVHHTFDSFYPKDGNPLVPDLTKNVGGFDFVFFLARRTFFVFFRERPTRGKTHCPLFSLSLFPVFVPF